MRRPARGMNAADLAGNQELDAVCIFQGGKALSGSVCSCRPTHSSPTLFVKPTSIRHWILAAVTLAAFLMYLDRACLSWMLDSDSFRRDMPLDAAQKDKLKSAFFFAYALMQVPAGWLAERFGKRVLMTVLIALWSGFTALSGFSTGFTLLFIARTGCGIAEAGAYPISSSLMARWVHVNRRGFFSGIVSLGGRLGGAVAPYLTAQIIVASDNWRYAGWLYGAFGIFAAWAFYTVFRERPEDHPRCNDAERALLLEGRSAAAIATPTARLPFPWRSLMTDGSLWWMCGMQFFTNIGWVFLINSMSGFLQHARHFSPSEDGRISSTALTMGLVGTLVGGLFTDACARRFGVRLGRMVPWVATRFLAACGYLIAMQVEQPWALILAFGLISFSSDAGLPATWAWASDVGGRNVAPIFGWGNMWGNFGAALQPIIFGWVLLNAKSPADWNQALLVGFGAYVLSGLCAFGINSARPIKGA